MSTESDAPLGSRLIAADRHARITKKFDGKWLAGLHEITILDSSCTRFPDFQIDTDNKSCTFTLLGTTYKGMLQQDGLNITWSDNSTWTLIKPNHADEEEESLTTTEPADSECSNKRRRHRKRHRHRKRRHHRSRTRREDDSSSSRNPIVKTHRKTHGNTVTLTHASTWRPHSPSSSHTKIALTKNSRKHPAGAPPNPLARKPLKITIAPPTPPPQPTYVLPEGKHVEAALDFESHLVVAHQPLADSTNLIVQNLPLGPCDLNGRWSTSANTIATINNNTCENFQSFSCNPNWRACFGKLGAHLYIGTLSDDGRVIRWDNGNTWIRLDPLHLTALYSPATQLKWGKKNLTMQHPAPCSTQHPIPHRAVDATYASTRINKGKASSSLSDTPHIEEPLLPPAAHFDEHPTIITDNGTIMIRIGAFDVLGRQLTFTPDCQEIWTNKADQPTGTMVILDCANLETIKHSTPPFTKGSTKEIYTWLEVQVPTFSHLIKQALRHVGDAVIHTYPHKNQEIRVIHVINPDFRETPDANCKTVAEKLTLALSNTLAVFLGTHRQHLRIQPIAAGINAGSFLPVLPILTVAAMTAAVQNLAPKAQERLSRCKLELCVTYQHEHKLYSTAFKNLGNKSYEELTMAAQQQLLAQQQRSKPNLARPHKQRPHQTASAPPPQYHQL